MTLPELAVKRPIATMMLLLSILVLGIIALSRLQLAFMPEVEDKRLYVSTDYANASPKAIERLIVRPLEEALSSLNGLEHMNSTSSSSGGNISLNFAFDVDMALARSEIHQRIDRIRDQLPDDVERVIVSDSRRGNENGETILEARISSGRDLSKNYDLLDRKIVRPLERISGVAVVTLDGVSPREVRVNLNLNKLRQHKIDARDVWRVISNNNQNHSLGILRTDSSRAFLRAVGAFVSVEEIGDLPLLNSNLKVSDVADITFSEPPLTYGRHLDGQFAIGLNIAKESSANTIEINEAIREKMASMKNDPELDGINFLVWQDQGKEIKNTLNDLQQTALFGGILASIILFIFLRSVTSTMVAVSCIPFSLIVACGVIWIQGKTLNTISLLGLIVGLGMLVDNAVVVMENIDRYVRKGYSGSVAALLGSKEVAVAVTTATLTSVIVFLPMIFTKPTEMNVMLQELGITIMITLLASLLISQTLIPLAASKLLTKPKKARKTAVMDRLQKHYVESLKFTLRHRWIALVAGLAVLVATLYPLQRMNFNFDPSPAEMFVGMGVNFSEAVSLEQKEAQITEIEQALEPYLEEFNVGSLYSWWSDGYSIVRLYMKTGFQNEQEMNKIRRKLPDILPQIPGVKISVQDSGSFWRRNSGKRIGVQLIGPDSESLSKLGEEALQKIQDIPGLFDFYSTADGKQLELQAEIDRERLSRYGLRGIEPSSLVEMTFRGRRLPRFKSEDGEVEMKLLSGDAEQTTVENLKNISLIKPDGKAIALDSVVDFSIQKSPRRIRREDKISSIWVGARYDKGEKSEYLKQTKQRLSEMKLPQGFKWKFNSRGRGEQESEDEFVLNLLLALGLIFAVMASLFESSRQALALMISLPFALAGAFWTLFLVGVDFDRPASVAVLLLLGIVVNNGIVMIEHINLYRREGWSREKAMLQGGKERLRPIIMTALTTLVGLVPIIIQKPSLGGVYYYSMAYVIIGGLLFSTLLTTIFLPATICLLEDAPAKFRQLGRGLINRT
ncbi:MAG: HAE1 family hydrophobic/amphiphilic exporter-1 [Enterobacterales bacterium]|jgi:HAE1 family hydrophobic/amphiphilic exporter-1